MNSKTDYIVQTLIEDENMPADLAALYPASSKISDAASTFIDKADQTFDKKNLVGRNAQIVADCIDICQQVVKQGAAISKLLRSPLSSSQKVDDRKRDDAARQAGFDDVQAEVVDEPKSITQTKETADE